MEPIEYTFEPRTSPLKDGCIHRVSERLGKLNAGGYDASTGITTPLRLSDDLYKDIKGDSFLRCDALDSIAASVESGQLDSEMWPSQLFSSEESYFYLIGILASYEEEFRFHDYWWECFHRLLPGCDENGCATAADMAERFAEVLDELPPQWQ